MDRANELRRRRRHPQLGAHHLLLALADVFPGMLAELAGVDSVGASAQATAGAAGAGRPRRDVFARRARHLDVLAHSLLNVGVLELRTRPRPEKPERLREAFEAFVRLRTPDGIAAAGFFDGQVLAARGEREEARKVLQEARRAAELVEANEDLAAIDALMARL